MKSASGALVLMLSVLLAAPAAAGGKDDPKPAKSAGESPKRLMEDGRRLLEMGKLEEAARVFRDAIAEAPDRPGPHWKLARTLARLRAKGTICEVGATEDAILDALEEAIRLGPDRVERLRKDGAFDSVRETFRFQRLLGLDPADEADLRTLLVLPEWRGPRGAYHLPVAVLDFHADGTLTLRRRAQDREANAAGPAPETTVLGTWHIEAGAVVLRLEDAEEEDRLLLGADGVLTGALGRFTNERSECQ